MVYLIIGLVLVLVLFIYFRYFKIPRFKNLTFIDGSLGTGKSFFTVAYAIRFYKKQHRKWWRSTHIWYHFFHIRKDIRLRLKNAEEPLLYSNMKLRNVPFTLITRDLLRRNNVRFNYKSVLLLDEFSLIADQMQFKDQTLNDELSIFFKLFRHETKGGYIFVNSQSTSDLHFSVKYCLSDYFYIHSRIRLPFISILKVQECRFTADHSSLDVKTEDVEDNLKAMVVLNKYFKYYDTYCYSIFTDSFKPLREDLVYKKKDSIKMQEIVSFNDRKVKKGEKNGEK